MAKTPLTDLQKHLIVRGHTDRIAAARRRRIDEGSRLGALARSAKKDA